MYWFLFFRSTRTTQTMSMCMDIYIYILCGSQRVFFPIRSSLVISSFWRNCWFIPIFPLFYRLVTSPKWYKLESTPTHVFSTLSCLKRTPTAPPRSTSTKSWPNWAVFKTLCHPLLRTVSGWHQPKWASHRFQWDGKDDQKVCGVMSGSC